MNGKALCAYVEELGTNVNQLGVYVRELDKQAEGLKEQAEQLCAQVEEVYGIIMNLRLTMNEIYKGVKDAE